MVLLAAVGVAPPAGADRADTFGNPAAPPPGLSSPDRDAFLAGAGGDDTRSTEATRTITVTPDADLVDGQAVTVQGTGFGDDAVTGILQCAKGLGVDGCDDSSLVIFNPPGNTFSRQFRVDAILHTAAGDIDCRTHAAGCRLIANDHYSLSGAARADLGFDPDGPLEPPPTVTVDPATDLVDGQVVNVTGGNLRPDEFLTLAQCPAGATDLYERCQNFFGLEADAGGNFEQDYQVEALLETYYYAEGSPEGTPRPEPVDCRVEACELVAVANDDIDRVGRAALSFDPDAPLRPDLVITVTPHQDLVDGQVVEVEAAGLTPDGPVDVVQCSLSSDLAGSGCELDRVHHLTADPAGEVATNYAVNEELDTPSGAVDCTGYSNCILVAVDRSVPIDFGRGYVFESLSFRGDEVVPPDPTPLPPRFAG